MTAPRRIAVVGTSNTGALKYAADTIAAEFPDLAVTFYGLPGGKFAEAAVDAEGRFRPAPGDAETARLAARINGTEALDLTEIDATFVISDTLGMAQTLFLAARCDVVDWPTRRDLPLISAACFQAAMETAIADRVDLLARQFRGVAPLYAALAPYPSVAVTRTGPHRQEPYASAARAPEIGRVHTLYRAALTHALARRGITFVPQPEETVAAPFLTKPAYAVGAMDFRAEGRILDDHRHMNAAFGASLFRAFALALAATEFPTPDTKE
ncbi:hypothetical protein [Roseicyclus persicicus]|uniref:SGNH/GDSL hydrolase family protein n=1 Tax=Roseicyclus persicicus TaxID=2650661 RepID=A0A7X6JYK7_9RHOB|nr:hypothetical protein [Roseibacterium persicicum]NKX44200.1 hypothetical protein [Roseibacterium persicicum]